MVMIRVVNENCHYSADENNKILLTYNNIELSYSVVFANQWL